MLFLDMRPNPTQQIIRAACQTDNVQKPDTLSRSKVFDP